MSKITLFYMVEFHTRFQLMKDLLPTKKSANSVSVSKTHCLQTWMISSKGITLRSGLIQTETGGTSKAKQAQTVRTQQPGVHG